MSAPGLERNEYFFHSTRSLLPPKAIDWLRPFNKEILAKFVRTPICEDNWLSLPSWLASAALTIALVTLTFRIGSLK